MTGKDLLLILGEINPQYYEEGEYQTIGDETHPRPAVRTLLIAALIALILAVPGQIFQKRFQHRPDLLTVKFLLLPSVRDAAFHFLGQLHHLSISSGSQIPIHPV